MSKRTRPWRETKARRRRARDRLFMRSIVVDLWLDAVERAWRKTIIPDGIKSDLLVISLMAKNAYDRARAAGLITDLADTKIMVTFER